MNKATEQHPGNQKEKLIIFDTTLRDGEQALAASLTIREKLRIALALESLGVDVIEAGFPVSSPADFESVQQIAAIVKNSTICGLARCVTRDIEIAADALSAADQFRLHVFLATSDLHIESKLRKSFDDILEMAQKSIHIARKFTDDVEFSCEDAGRTSPDNLCRIVEHAIKSGATTINIPDTVGYTVPSQFGKIITDLYQRVPNIDKAIISVHCHDDLGMSVANSISAIEAGARQVEGTLNGIGERAGNCALEEIIMALKVRSDHFKIATNINCEKLHRTSNLVSQICNMPIPANKAIVGSNAFSHSSGIHQDGVLKNRETYEILTPESIGIKNVKLNLTSRSGRAAVRNAMAEMGYSDATNDYDLENLYADFLALADKKGQIFDYDLEALAFIGAQKESSNYFNLENLSYQTDHEISQAEITLRCGEESHLLKASGNGPIDAIFKAIQSKMDFHSTLESCVMQAKGIGRDALGQVDVCLKYKERAFHGIGLATDTVEAATQAFISALNHIQRSLIVSQYKKKSKKEKGI